MATPEVSTFEELKKELMKSWRFRLWWRFYSVIDWLDYYIGLSMRYLFTVPELTRRERQP